MDYYSVVYLKSSNADSHVLGNVRGNSAEWSKDISWQYLEELCDFIVSFVFVGFGFLHLIIDEVSKFKYGHVVSTP